MTVEEMHYEFKLKLNKIDSQDYSNFLVPEIDWYLNEAQELFVKYRYGSKSNQKLEGFEVTQKRIDDLRNLVVKDRILPAISSSSDPAMFEVHLPSDYMFSVRVYANGAKESCEGRLSCIQTQHDDLTDTLKNPFYAPSFEWREVPIVFGTSGSTTADLDKLFVYSDGSFAMTSMVMDYLRHPLRIAFPLGFAAGQYVLPNSVVINTNQNCELARHTHREIVDIAVKLASGDMEHPAFQQKMMKTSESE